MAADPYPNLGFDPCPGDLPGYQALARYAAQSAASLAQAVSTLASAGSGEWLGQAADAFRGHLDHDVLPLARSASDSVGSAAAALGGWAATLAALQAETRTLDQQAAPHRDELDAALRSVGPARGHECAASLSGRGQAGSGGPAGGGQYGDGGDHCPGE